MRPRDRVRNLLFISALCLWALSAPASARPQNDAKPSTSPQPSSASVAPASPKPAAAGDGAPAPECVCSPDCPKNMSAADCPEGRVAARPDCACCVVCAGQRGAACDKSLKPCDADFGFVCSEAGICQAAHNCTADSNCSSSEFCHGGVCVDPCKVLNPCDRSLRNGICVANGHRAVCQCPLGFVNVGPECKPVKCTHHGMEYSYADSVYKSDCQQKCTCSASGEMTCSMEYACAPGFFRRGTYAKDPLCYEDGDAPFADECCVTVLCSSAKNKGKDTPGSTSTTEKASSPKVDEVSSPAPPAAEEVVEAELKLNETTSQKPAEELEPSSSPSSSSAASPEVTSSSVSNSTSETSPGSSPPLTPSSDPTTPRPPITAQETSPADDFPSSVLEIVNISHNQTTLKLPDTLGGLLYLVTRDRYSGNSTRWDTLSIPAGAHSYTVMHLRPGTEYLMRWNTPDSMTPAASFRTQDGCVVEDVSYGTDENYAVGCVSLCKCLASGKVECTQRCRHFRRQLELGSDCQEVPDPSDPLCCVIKQCTPSSSTPPAPKIEPPPAVDPITENEKTENRDFEKAEGRDFDRTLPNLLVTETTYQSFTVAWDEFRPRSHSQGYLVQYKRAREPGSSAIVPWHDIQVDGDRPLVKVGGLLPNTNYEVRVSIAGDFLPPISTPTISVTTKIGCVQNGTSYDVGAEVRIACEKLCRCLKNGSMTCSQRCVAPFVPRGSMNVTSDCQERPDGDDGCCVIVSCAQPPSGSAPVVSAGTPTEILPGDDFCKAGNTTYKVGDEFFDGCESKCICSASSQIECQPRCAVRTHTSLPPGCSLSADPKDSCCSIIVCENGVGGGIASRDNNKPSVPSLPFEGCVYKNNTYQKLERFHDGCERQCQCMGYDDISCLPRCPPSQNVTGKPDCVTLPDPGDPCCRVTICGSILTDVNRTAAQDDLNRIDDHSKSPPVSEITDRIGNELAKPSSSAVGLYSTTPGPSTAASSQLIIPNPVELKTVTILDSSTVRLELDLKDAVRRALEDGTTSLILHYGTDLVRFRQKKILWSEVTRNGSFGSFVEIRLPDLTSGIQYFFQLEFQDFKSSTATASVPQDLPVVDVTSPRAEALTSPMTALSIEARSSTLDPTGLTSELITSRSSSVSTESNGQSAAAGCEHEGVIHPVGAEFFKGCSSRCHCMGPSFPHCVPRCWKQSVPAPGSNCTVGPDPLDPCCTVVRCFETVPQGQEVPKLDSVREEVVARGSLIDIPAITEPPPNGCFHKNVLLSVGANYTKGCQTCLCLGPGIEHCAPRCQYTADSLVPEPGCALVPLPNDACCFELKCPEKRPRLKDENEDGVDGRGCWQNGKWLPVYKRVYDGCKSFCMCSPSGKMECAAIECPDTFALEYIHHDCFEWGPAPNVTVEPPDCCPEYVCINDGTCEYKGKKFSNFEVIPTELSGCDQKCECEFGSVACNRMCPLISSTPPSTLSCPPHVAQLVVNPENKCCKIWRCPATTTTTTTSTTHATPASSPIQSTNNIHENLEANCVYDGKEYRTGEEWTEGPSCRLKRCKCILDPDGIARARCEGGCAEISERQLWPSARCPFPHLMEFPDPCVCPSVACGPPIEITQPSTTSTTTTTTSTTTTSTTTARTTTTTEAPRSVELAVNLGLVSIERTKATLKWRKFTDNETQYIDGIQIRHKKARDNSQVWKTSLLLHRDRTEYELRSLEPDTEYRALLTFIPFPKQSVDLYTNESLDFRTLPLPDEYNFSIVVSAENVTSDGIVVRWSGAPYPPEKYVNVYQVVYQPPGQLDPIAKIFVDPKDRPVAPIDGLKPRSVYRVWVSAFLANGENRRSNVIEVLTLHEIEATFTQVPNELEGKGQTSAQKESVGSTERTEGDKPSGGGSYFGAMIALAIFATVAILGLVVAVVLLVRRQTRAKALEISEGKPYPVHSSSIPVGPGSQNSQQSQPYQNPSFKNHVDGESHEMNGMNGNNEPRSRRGNP